MATPDQGAGESVPAASEQSGSSSRAGRNLPVAIGVGVFLGAIVVVLLLFWRQGFLLVIVAAISASIWEMRSTLATRGINLVWPPLLVGVAATIVLTWWYTHTAQVLGVALTALAILIWRLRVGAKGFVADSTASLFLLVYLGLFATFATLLVRPHDGSARILMFLIPVVCSDVGGYAAGVLFGKHPMAPTISPKKSWEGFAGSLILAGTGGSLAMWLLMHHPWWQGLIIGLCLALTATAGDLIESLIKRDLGVKDMGNLLPGHGGVMDRLDSLLPSAMVSWGLLNLFAPA